MRAGRTSPPRWKPWFAARRPRRSSCASWRRSWSGRPSWTRCGSAAPAVERQVQELESLGSRLAEAQRQAERLATAGEEMDRIQARMGDLGHKVEGALQLREDVERVLSMEGPVSALRNEAEALRGQIAEMSKASAGSGPSTTTP